MGQGHGKHLRDLSGLDDGGEGLGQPGHERRDGEASDGFMRGQAADYLCCAVWQGDFFAGFAQGGGLQVGVRGVELAAGKCHLPGMVFQPRGAFGQVDERRCLKVADEDQHCGIAQKAALGAVRIRVEIEVRGGRAGLTQSGLHPVYQII